MEFVELLRPDGAAGLAGSRHPGAAGRAARGTANELVLVFSGRLPPDSLKLDGDRHVLDRLIACDPD